MTTPLKSYTDNDINNDANQYQHQHHHLQQQQQRNTDADDNDNSNNDNNNGTNISSNPTNTTNTTPTSTQHFVYNRVNNPSPATPTRHHLRTFGVTHTSEKQPFAREPSKPALQRRSP